MLFSYLCNRINMYEEFCKTFVYLITQIAVHFGVCF